ncbi:hypothetical protein ACLBKS_05070 [Hylemonella sp. W303a]|uniref:hypothetical protein n=1 Tax=Hylemonella sp. W303a TaxID=3389873 RepID=UPI00396AF2A3
MASTAPITSTPVSEPAKAPPRLSDERKPLSALVVVHDPALKQRLVQVLAAMTEVGAVRGAHTLEPGLVAIDGGMVDLLLADLDLPEEGGPILIRHARRRLASCKVLALATPATAETRMPAALNLGALGWLRMDAAQQMSSAEITGRIRQFLAD